MPRKALQLPLHFLFPANERCRYAGKNIFGRDRINFRLHRLMDNRKEPPQLWT